MATIIDLLNTEFEDYLHRTEEEEDKQNAVIVKKARGHMPGLAKHLAKKLGGDPHFFSKCMGDEELAGYDPEVRKAICAKAHKLAIGIWPGAHGGKDPNANEKQLEFVFMEELPVITIDNQEDDDWMKTLPGYADEISIHEELAAAHAAKVIKKEYMPIIIAKRGDNYFLVKLDEHSAVVVNKEARNMSRQMHPDAFLKFGYWEATEEVDPDVISIVKEKL